MPQEVQKLTEVELRSLLIDEIRLFILKLDASRPIGELEEIRKNIRRMYLMLNEGEKIELQDIFGNNYLQSFVKDQD